MSSSIEPPPPATSGKAIASLILGLFSFVFSLLTAIPALILGLISLNQINRDPTRLTGRGLAIGGIIASVMGMMINFVLVAILVGLLLPAVMMAREAARRAHSASNMKMIDIALHTFQTYNERFPAPAGSPAEVPVSWRVRILSYLELDVLHDQYDFKQPWDSAANRPVTDRPLPIYQRLGDPPSNKTRFLALVGPGTAFEADKGVSPEEFTDGLSNTILFVEADPARAVPWAEPKDIDYDPANPLAGIGQSGTGQFLAAMADGSVQTLSGHIDPAVFRAMVSRNGQEPVSAPDFFSPPDSR